MIAEWLERLRSPTLVSLTLGVLACLLVVWLRGAGYLQLVEFASYDFYLRIKERNRVPDPHIVLVQVGEKDIQRLQEWPLSDASLAGLIETLAGYSPRVIGVDIYRDNPVPPGTEELDRLLAGNKRVVFIEKFGQSPGTHVPAPAILRDTEQVGFADVTVDADGVVRRGLLFLDDGVNFSMSLSLRLALAFLADQGIVPQPGEPDPQHMRLGATTLRPFEANDGAYVNADAAGYQYLLDYKGGVVPFQIYSLAEVSSGSVDADLIKDSIVIVGVSALSVKDEFLTPYDRFAGHGQSTAGIVVHAYLTSQLLRAALEGDTPPAFLSDALENLWILLWGVTAAIVAGRFAESAWRFSLFAAGGLALLIGATLVAFVHGWWLPVVPAALNWLASGGLVAAYLSNYEKAEKKLLMDLFSRNVSPAVADEMWKQRGRFISGGRLEAQTMTATVLFSDLANFTPIAERLAPQELMSWLNNYMETMAGLVTRYGGVVDDYYGDAIKANFGVPMPRTTAEEVRQDAINAVNCALALRQEMLRLNQAWAAEGAPLVRMRVGIATGPVVAGCLGSAERMKYTTIGDVVNTAARLESYGKQVPGDSADEVCKVMLSAHTVEQLDDSYALQPVGELKLKGKSEQVMVFRLLGNRVNMSQNA